MPLTEYYLKKRGQEEKDETTIVERKIVDGTIYTLVKLHSGFLPFKFQIKKDREGGGSGSYLNYQMEESAKRMFDRSY